MVELTSLKVGDSFERALVRFQCDPNKYNRCTASLTVRQEAPLEYKCKIEEPIISRISFRFAAWARRNVTLGEMIWISGTKTAQLELYVSEVCLYRDGLSRLQQPAGATEKCFSVGDNVTKRKVLEDEPGTLLKHLLEYVPPDDIARGVIPVCGLWSSIGLSILQSYRRLGEVNVEATLYDVFQSAQRGKNMRAWRPFEDKREYVALMAAGAKLCDLCICGGRNVTLHDTYVKHDLVEILRLERPHIGGHLKRTYTCVQLNFIKASLIQLSKLDLDQHMDHIKRIGCAMRNSPRLFFHRNWNVDDWTKPLRVDNLFCRVFKTAIEELYGNDWNWERLPGEREKGPIIMDSSAVHKSSWHEIDNVRLIVMP